MKLWKLGIVVLAGVMLAGTVVGIVAAQTDGGTPTTDGDVAPHKARGFSDLLPRLAENLGISPEELTAAIQQTQLELVDERLAAGDLTEEEATRIRERIESGEGRLFGGGHGSRHGCGRQAVQQVAEFLGLTPEDVIAAKQDGQSLAQIAEANGVGAAELAAFLLSQIEERVADALAEGKIDQARADEVLENAPERIDQKINRSRTSGEDGLGRFQPSRFPAPIGAEEGSLL